MKTKPLFFIFGFAGLVFVHLLLLKTITYTAWPEMFSYPYLINKGFLIYKDFAHPYVPLLSFILSVYYKVVGISLASNQFFTWGLILINDLLILLIAKKFINNYFVFVPLTIYVLLQPIFEGNMLWFDLATVPFILGSLMSILYFKSVSNRLFWFGFFLSLALLIKQQTIVLVFLSAIILLITKETRKYFFRFILGGVIPVVLVLTYLLALQILNEYIFWTLEFPLVWLPKFPGYSDLPGAKDIIMLIILFGLPIGYLLKNPLKLDLFKKIVLVSIIATVIMAFPRFSYFHLQPALAILIIFYVIALNEKKKIGIILLFIGIFYGLLFWKDYRPFIGIETARFYDQQDLNLAKFVKENTKEEDTVYFLGPHSLIFVLAERIPPKPWIENFVWHFEIPGMQNTQLEGFKKEKNLVIFKQGPISGNWYDLGSYQPKEVVSYIDQNFKIIGKDQSGVEVWKRKD